MNKSITFLLIMLSHSAVAQKIYSVDSNRNGLYNLPFDQKFIIEIHDPNSVIESVEVFRLFARNGELKEKTLLINGNKSLFVLSPIPEEGGIVHLAMPPLKADLRFESIITNKFRGKALNSLFEVFLKYKSSDPNRHNAMTLLSQKLEPPNPLGKTRAFLGRYWLAGPLGNYGTQLDNFYQYNIKPFFEPAIDQSKTPAPNPALSNLTEANLRKANIQYKKTESSFVLYSRFLHVYQTKEVELFSGLVQILPQTSSTELHNLESRIVNLKGSLLTIEQLIQSTREVVLLDGSQGDTYDKIIDDFEAIKRSLTNNLKFLTDALARLIKAIDSEPNMRYTTWFMGSNEVWDLKTRGSYYLIPAIGLTHIITPDEQSNFTKPFVGVNIHLRPVDKSLSFHDLNNSFWHRLSLFSGLTVTQIKDHNQEYFDWFNNMSLMAGLNYQFRRSMGVSGGVVIMNRSDPNPLILKRQTVANGYAAITFDVDFTSSLKSLTSKIGL